MQFFLIAPPALLLLQPGRAGFERRVLRASLLLYGTVMLYRACLAFYFVTYR